MTEDVKAATDKLLRHLQAVRRAMKDYGRTERQLFQYMLTDSPYYDPDWGIRGDLLAEDKETVLQHYLGDV